jgi:hypothetical protein
MSIKTVEVKGVFQQVETTKRGLQDEDSKNTRLQLARYGNSTGAECLSRTRSESCDTLVRMSQTSDEGENSDEQGAAAEKRGRNPRVGGNS